MKRKYLSPAITLMCLEHLPNPVQLAAMVINRRVSGTRIARLFVAFVENYRLLPPIVRLVS